MARIRVLLARARSTSAVPVNGAALLANLAGATIGPLALSGAAVTFNTNSVAQSIAFDSVVTADAKLYLGMDGTGGGRLFLYRPQSTSYIFTVNADGSQGSSIAWSGSLPAGRVLFTNTNGVYRLSVDGVQITTFTGSATGNTYVKVDNHNAGGFGNLPLPNTVYGGIVVPLQITSSSLTNDFHIQFTIAYTHPAGSVTGIPNVQLYLADGVTPVGPKQPGVMVGNPSGGIASFTTPSAYSSAQFGTSPKFTLFNTSGGVETGTNVTGTIVMPGAVAKIGIGLGYPNNIYQQRTHLNLLGAWGDFSSGGYPVVGADINEDYNLLRMPTAGGSWRCTVGHPVENVVDLGGGRYKGTVRIRWKGTAAVRPNEGTTAGGVANQSSGTAGGYNYIQFDHVFDGYTSGNFAFIYVDSMGTGSNLPTDFYCAEVDSNGNYLYDPALEVFPPHTALIGLFDGNVRAMDPQRGSEGDLPYTVFTDANRSRNRFTNDGSSGWSFETLGRYSTNVQRGLDLIIPSQADDTYIRSMTRFFLAHAATLPTSSYHTFGLANEPWNSGQAAENYYRAKGASRNNATPGRYLGDEYAVGRKCFSDENARVMAVVTDEANLQGKLVNGKIVGLKRLVNVQSGNTSNAGEMIAYNQSGMGLTDIISVAPYVGGGTANSPSPTTDIGVIIDRMRARIPTVMNEALAVKNYATANGKEFDCYEGLVETVGSSALDSQVNRDPRVAQLVTDILDGFNTIVGGPGCLHIYTLTRRGGQYALTEFATQSRTTAAFGLPPAYKLDAVLHKIAAFHAL